MPDIHGHDRTSNGFPNGVVGWETSHSLFYFVLSLGLQDLDWAWRCQSYLLWRYLEPQGVHTLHEDLTNFEALRCLLLSPSVRASKIV